MAVVFQSFSIQNADSTDTADVVLNKPSGTVDGDLLIAIIARSNAGGATMATVPSGWTEIQLSNSGGGSVPILGTYFKIASSEPSSWTWSFSGSAAATGGAVMRITGQGGTPIEASAKSGNESGSTPSFANTITPSSGGGMIIFAVASRGNSNAFQGYAVVTDDPTWAERFEDDATQGNTFACATAQRPETSATGNSSLASLSGGAISVAHLIYIALERDVTVTPAVINLTGEVQAPAISGDANFSVGVLDLASAVQDPTVTIEASKIKNTDKSSESSITNTPKS